jgi:hypothetical protein
MHDIITSGKKKDLNSKHPCYGPTASVCYVKEFTKMGNFWPGKWGNEKRFLSVPNRKPL